MKSGNRPALPDSRTVPAIVWIAASAALVVTILAGFYVMLGRPDAELAAGWFPQLASGARRLTSAMAAADSPLATVLRAVVVSVVIALVLVIGSVGAWDAWQSRQQRTRDARQLGGVTTSSGAPASRARTRDAEQALPLESDAETLYSPDVARARIRRTLHASNDPDTLQGGTA